mgnify:CR=1 FL=1
MEEPAAARLERVLFEIKKVIVGQDEVEVPAGRFPTRKLKLSGQSLYWATEKDWLVVKSSTANSVPSPVVPNSAMPSQPFLLSMATCSASKAASGRKSFVSGVAAATIRQSVAGSASALLVVFAFTGSFPSRRASARPQMIIDCLLSTFGLTICAGNESIDWSCRASPIGGAIRDAGGSIP